MTILTEGRHAGEALVSELPGGMSRDVVTIASGQKLAAGAVLGKVTASGKYAAFNGGGSDGTETAVAILFEAVDATAGDKKAVVFYKDAVFNAKEVVWPAGATSGHKADGTADLKDVGIILR